MSKLIITTLLCYATSFIACQVNKPCSICPPQDTVVQGKRDYIWSIDSVNYEGRPTRIELENIWGSSASDVWGVAGDAQDVRDCLWHFDGTAWKRATDGTPITQYTGNKVVYAAWGTAKNNVWTVGRTIKSNTLSAFIMHFDGKTWSDVTPPNVQSIAGHLYNIYGVSDNDIWVGGYEYALHYDGLQWTPYKVEDSIIVGCIAGNGRYIYAGAYSPWGKNIQLAYLFSGNRFILLDKTTDAEFKFGGVFWATQTKLYSIANGVISVNILNDGKIDSTAWQREFNTPTFFSEKFVHTQKDIFVVGQWNLIYHYNGVDWKQIVIAVQNHTVDPYSLFCGVWTNGVEAFICDTQNGIVYHGK